MDVCVNKSKKTIEWNVGNRTNYKGISSAMRLRGSRLGKDGGRGNELQCECRWKEVASSTDVGDLQAFWRRGFIGH